MFTNFVDDAVYLNFPANDITNFLVDEENQLLAVVADGASTSSDECHKHARERSLAIATHVASTSLPAC
jgi:hypothetical protein